MFLKMPVKPKLSKKESLKKKKKSEFPTFSSNITKIKL